MSNLARFERKFVKDLETGCWLWIAGVSAGYGMFWTGRATVQAHRVAWLEYKGPIPERMRVDHRCSNKLCVNPEHLELRIVGGLFASIV